MTDDQARDEIGLQIRVTQADIVEAKAYLTQLPPDTSHPIRDHSTEWARGIAPRAPRELNPEREDVGDQIASIARFLSARLALCTAAWDLVRNGAVVHHGSAQSEQPQWTVRTQRRGGGISWGTRFELFYPDYIVRPGWLDRRSELFDSTCTFVAWLTGTSSLT